MENKRLKLKIEYAFQDLQSLIEDLVTEVENAEDRLVEQQGSYEDDIKDLEEKIDELEDKLTDANEEIRELKRELNNK